MHDKACNIAKDPKHDGYQRGLASMVCNVFDKNSFGSGIKNENISKKKSWSIEESVWPPLWFFKKCIFYKEDKTLVFCEF